MWTPDKNSKTPSPKEIVGRRVFGNNLYNDGGLFRIDIFYDSRVEEDLSVDRLGIRVPDSDVVMLLTPLGDQHGEILGKPFAGWATINVKALKSIAIHATPQPSNVYHAEISRDGYRDRHLAETLAFRLAYTAKELIAPAR